MMLLLREVLRRRNAATQSCTQVDAKESGCRIRTRRSLTDLTAPRVQPKANTMLPITQTSLRTSFVNASRKEAADLTLPADFDTIDWNRLDYLGWRDPKLGKRAYAIVPTLDGDLIGILFRQAEASPRSRAQCSWCQDVKLPNDVELRRSSRPRVPSSGCGAGRYVR